LELAKQRVHGKRRVPVTGVASPTAGGVMGTTDVVAAATGFAGASRAAVGDNEWLSFDVINTIVTSFLTAKRILKNSLDYIRAGITTSSISEAHLLGHLFNTLVALHEVGK